MNRVVAAFFIKFRTVNQQRLGRKKLIHTFQLVEKLKIIGSTLCKIFRHDIEPKQNPRPPMTTFFAAVSRKSRFHQGCDECDLGCRHAHF
jgi:hypothetical protein